MKAIKKSIFTMILCVFIMTPLCVFGAEFESEFDFYSYLKGTSRHLDSGTINVDTWSHVWNDGSHVQSSDNFELSLFRDGVLSNTCIGTVRMRRDGHDTAQWINMSSGNYFFTFSKGNDGTSCYGAIYVWQ